MFPLPVHPPMLLLSMAAFRSALIDTLSLWVDDISTAQPYLRAGKYLVYSDPVEDYSRPSVEHLIPPWVPSRLFVDSDTILLEGSSLADPV